MTQALDHASPWVFDSRPLGRRPGSMKPIDRAIVANGPFGLDLIKVADGTTINLKLRAESVVEGVLISGSVTTDVVGECARCLEPVTDKIDVEICELYAYADSVTQETTDSDEVSRLAGDLIDLEPVVRDAIVLALPVIPHCREDCRGLCAVCGERLDDLPADHAHDAVDERWAALRQLLTESDSQSDGKTKE